MFYLFQDKAELLSFAKASARREGVFLCRQIITDLKFSFYASEACKTLIFIWLEKQPISSMFAKSLFDIQAQVVMRCPAYNIPAKGCKCVFYGRTGRKPIFEESDDIIKQFLLDLDNRRQ